MKKFFSFATALIFAMSLSAKEVVFDFSDPASLGFQVPDQGAGVDLTDATQIEVDGVIFTNHKVANTSTRIWNAGGNCELRVYTNSTITFTATENITAIKFEGSAIGFSEFTGNDWVGEALSVTLTANMTNKISKAHVFIGETPEVWVPDTINVAKAFELIDAGDSNPHFVVGIVATAPFDQFSSFGGRVSLYLVDDLASTDSLQAYQIYAQDNQRWESLEAAQEELHIGDTILVYAGGLKLYAAKNIYEIDPGYYVEMLGLNPDAPQEQLDTISAADAKALAESLAENTTSDKIAIDCYIASIKSEWNATYNNISLWINDDPTSTYGLISTYRTKADAEVGPTLAAGDHVLIVGKVAHSTYESNGEIKHSYQVAEGAQLTLIEKGQGIENIEVTNELKKVMVDGVVYIVRDGKMYNALGTQVK